MEETPIVQGRGSSEERRLHECLMPRTKLCNYLYSPAEATWKIGWIGARARSVTRERRIDALARTRLRTRCSIVLTKTYASLDVPVSSVRGPRATYIKARPAITSAVALSTSAINDVPWVPVRHIPIHRLISSSSCYYFRRLLTAASSRTTRWSTEAAMSRSVNVETNLSFRQYTYVHKCFVRKDISKDRPLQRLIPLAVSLLRGC